MNIKISAESFIIKNLLLIAFLLLANITGIISTHIFQHDYLYGLVPLFNFDREMNVPTLYSAAAILLASLLLFKIALHHKKHHTAYIPWFGLGCIFIFLAIDEASVLHEGLIVPVRESLNTSGLLFYAWVIPYGIGLMIFLAIYAKFLLSLEKRTMWLFITSGSIFVVGAIGFELLGGQHAEIHGRNNLMYSVIYSCEELLEMLGIALFNYTLFCQITQLDAQSTYV